MKPGDPDVFVTSIAAVLADYPLGLVRECVDPRSGMARSSKFLSVAELVEWLERRLEHHTALAAYVPRVALPPPPVVYSADHKATMAEMWGKLVARLTGARLEDPVTKLRRESREAAAERLAADKARALDKLRAGA